MNKKRLTILLSSIVAGAGLVGATFAGWAVTDEANPFGIKVTPKDIETAETYETILLEWGNTTGFTDIGGLTLGEANAAVRTVEVKSTSSKASEAIGGTLVASLEDLTVRPTEDTRTKLIDNLVVKVYKGEVLQATIDKSVTTHSVSQYIATENGVATALTFKVYIPTDSVTPEQYEEMRTDTVYLKIDWNKPSTATPEVQASMVYFRAKTPYDVKVYAWSSTTMANNGEFGTVSMSPVSGNYYSYLLSNEFDRVIFKYGDDSKDQTDDLEVTTTIRQSTPMYDFSLETPAWVVAEIAAPEYYLIGTINAWSTVNDYKLTYNEVSHLYSYTINSVPENFEFKIFDNVNKIYYAETATYDGAPNCNWGDAGDKIRVDFSPEKALKNGDNVDVYVLSTKLTA